MPKTTPTKMEKTVAIITASIFLGRSASIGFSTSFVKIFFCSLSNEEAYSYLPRGLEIFVNCELISFFIFDFWLLNVSKAFFESRYFL